MNTLTQDQINEIIAAANVFTDPTRLSRSDILRIVDTLSNIDPKEAEKTFFWTDKYRVSRGVIDITRVVEHSKPKKRAARSMSFSAPENKAAPSEDALAEIPAKDPAFVKWGHYKVIEDIVGSYQFFPVYVAGMSGNGKTMCIEQACANMGREMIRVQISPEEDTDSLIGGFRLVNGETVFHHGPVIRAMRAGAICLLDEIDRGSNKLLAIQGILEGKPYLIKQTGELIRPAHGFNIIATANSLGSGSPDGRYSAVSVIDDAFLERFIITIEQPNPDAAVEESILRKMSKALDITDAESFITKLVSWSGIIRKTFDAGAVDGMVSTRRLCHILRTYAITGDRKRSIDLCVGKYDSVTAECFKDLYAKIDGDTTLVLPNVTIDTQNSF